MLEEGDLRYVMRAERGKTKCLRIRPSLGAFSWVFDCVTLLMNTEPRLDEGVLTDRMWPDLTLGLGGECLD